MTWTGQDKRPPQFRITLELEPVEAWCHADARHAANLVVDAIEQVRMGSPDFEGAPFVRVMMMAVSKTEGQR
jgi:hypothetical protein